MAENRESKGKSDKQTSQLVEKKLALVSKIREQRAEIAKLNLELHRAGVDSALIACW